MAGLKPEPLLTVSEWSDQYRVLSTKSSAEPGRWRTSRTPYLKDIMDALSPSQPYQEIVFKKGSQIGASEMGNNWIAYIIDQNPGPVMVVQPTIDLAKKFSQQRITPMLEATEKLKGKITEKKSRDSQNQILLKSFFGGILICTGANSPVGLRSMPIRYGFLDEVSAYPKDCGGEGDPVKLAEKRLATFGARKKIFKPSTPKIEGSCRIDADYQKTDQRKYFVPCPHCNGDLWLNWDGLIWDEDENKEPIKDTVRYTCEHCGSLIENHEKTGMLAKGKWISTAPENTSKDRIGFHLSALYSPVGWCSWYEIIRDYCDARNENDDEKMKTHINTNLGECFEQKGDAPEWQRLYDRRESYKIGTVPDGVAFLTCAVDVQKDRLEVEVKGWGPKMRSWSVDHLIFHGDTEQPAAWQELAALVHKEYYGDKGQKFNIKKMCVDSSYRTQKVYDWCRRYPMQRVIAIKGADEMQQVASRIKNVDVKIDGKAYKRGARMCMIGSSMIKSQIYGWLKQDTPETDQPDPYGFARYPEYDQEWFKQLCAEKLVKQKDRRGFDKYVWVKIRDRNEALDLFVMNRAAAYMCGIDRFNDDDWKKLNSEIKIEKKPEKSDNVATTSIKTHQRKQKNKKSSFWD